jgi:hypothetical protein
MVVLAYNPNYSRGKDLEDCNSRPAWAKSLGDTHLNQQASCSDSLLLFQPQWRHGQEDHSLRIALGKKSETIGKVN